LSSGFLSSAAAGRIKRPPRVASALVAASITGAQGAEMLIIALNDSKQPLKPPQD
jgi:hypothetical protein